VSMTMAISGSAFLTAAATLASSWLMMRAISSADLVSKPSEARWRFYRILLIFVAEPVWGARLDRRRPRCESRIGCATLEARLSELAKAPPQCSVSPSLWCFPMLSMTMKTRVRPQATRPN
jgi:hypothetical protein